MLSADKKCCLQFADRSVCREEVGKVTAAPFFLFAMEVIFKFLDILFRLNTEILQLVVLLFTFQ